MSLTKALNSKSNIKQFSNADLPVIPRQPVIARYAADSTLSQTTINLPFQVDTVNAQDSFFLAIDGKILTIGAANDFVMSAIDVLGYSSVVTLSSAIPAGLNIQAWKLGLKKETEFAQDQRFTNLYENLGQALPTFVAQNILVSATSSTPSAGQFWSTITNRAAIVDMSQDLKPRMGVERIQISSLMGVQDESDSSGLQVMMPTNDPFNQMRFVGAWSNNSAADGQFVSSATIGDYMEITFYGTGLNLNMDLAYSGMNATYQVDNGAASANIFAAAYSAILDGRYYNANQILPVVSGLTQGIHTVKLSIAAAVALKIYGVEILNVASTPANVVTPGGVSYGSGKKASSTLTSAAYNSGFESGTLGTRGGRVSVYQKSDGTIAKAVQPTDAAAAYLASATHANEEVAKSYYWKDFSAGRTDDFSAVPGSNVNVAFTAEDGTTTLVGNQVRSGGGSPESLTPYPSGGFVTLTFVGTGIDLVARGVTSVEVTSVTIDGTNVGNLTYPAAYKQVTLKLASGLPYGTHTVKITRTAFVAGSPEILSFIIYQPKTPSIPSGAINLGSYNLMADYVANATQSIGYISTGVLRKMGTRESTYVGTWPAMGLDTTNFNSGWNTSGTTTATSYTEYSFFGTGCEFKSFINNAQVINWTFAVDSSSNLSSFTTSFTSTVTGLTLTAATGLLNGTSAGSGIGSVKITGLTLGFHKIRVTQNAATGNLYNDCIDIITPIHSHAAYEFDLTNNVIAASIFDHRELAGSALKSNLDKITAKYISGTSGTSNITTTSTSFVPIPAMTVSLKLDRPTKFNLYGSLLCYNATGSYQSLAFAINGVQLPNDISVSYGTAGIPGNLHTQTIVELMPGSYNIAVMWKTSTGTLIFDTADGGVSKLLVEEI